MKLLAVASLVLILSTPAVCHAWGSEGHRIVADLAQERLTPQTRESLRELMGTDDIVRWATWADDIRRERPETARWHYVDIPGSAKGYKSKRDCPGRDCVVGKIEEYSAILRDRREPVTARREALKFLVHFVADVHQPFHAIGDARGGNEVPDVEFGSTRCGFRPCELHGTWDSGLLRHTGVREHRYADQLDAMILQEHLRASGKPEEWANESLRDAKAAWVSPDANIDKAYLQRELPVMNERLAIAGLRLAALLNADLSSTR